MSFWGLGAPEALLEPRPRLCGAGMLQPEFYRVGRPERAQYPQSMWGAPVASSGMNEQSPGRIPGSPGCQQQYSSRVTGQLHHLRAGPEQLPGFWPSWRPSPGWADTRLARSLAEGGDVSCLEVFSGGACPLALVSPEPGLGCACGGDAGFRCLYVYLKDKCVKTQTFRTVPHHLRGGVGFNWVGPPFLDLSSGG